MKIKPIIFIIVLIFRFVSNVNSQEFCFVIDNIKVNYIPLYYTSAFDADINLLKRHGKHIVIKDSLILSEFSNIELIDKSLINTRINEDYSLDLRMIIYVYFNNSSFYIKLNNVGFYSVFDEIIYLKNKELVSWIEKYVLYEKWYNLLEPKRK